MRAQPILVLSLPRSGSSWVGDILGTATGAAYLREPLTRSYMFNEGRGHPSVFEVGAGAPVPTSYAIAAGKVAAGLPDFRGTVVAHPEQWALGTRTNRALIVKEVNPLAIEFMLERLQPRVIYLARHPVPVARSFFSQGWTDHLLKDRVSATTLAGLVPSESPLRDSFWFNHGALHALAHARVLDALGNGPTHCVARYEDLCLDPLGGFERLFDFCRLPFDAPARERVIRSVSSADSYRPGEYSLQRNSRAMIDSWRSSVAAGQIEEVRQGYFAMPTSLYAAEADWLPMAADARA